MPLQKMESFFVFRSIKYYFFERPLFFKFNFFLKGNLEMVIFLGQLFFLTKKSLHLTHR